MTILIGCHLQRDSNKHDGTRVFSLAFRVFSGSHDQAGEADFYCKLHAMIS